MELTIIIPHYNSVDSLTRLLDSIPIIDEIQVIVVDDKSTSCIKELDSLIHSQKYSHVLFLKNDTNKKGAGVCRNIGINNAIGKWILFADADDFFVEGFYNQVKKYFSSNNDVVFFRSTSIEIDSGEKSNRHEHFEKLINNFRNINDHESEVFLRYCYFVPWSKLILSKVLKENNIYFEEVMVANDVMFSTKLGYHIKHFTTSSDIIYCVTRSSGSLTTNISANVYDTRLQVYIDYRNFLQKNLNKSDFKLLNLNGLIMVINAIKYKLGLRKILSVIWTLKKNRFILFDKRLLYPTFFAKRIMDFYKSNRSVKKYYVK